MFVCTALLSPRAEGLRWVCRASRRVSGRPRGAMVSAGLPRPSLLHEGGWSSGDGGRGEKGHALLTSGFLQLPPSYMTFPLRLECWCDYPSDLGHSSRAPARGGRRCQGGKLKPVGHFLEIPKMPPKAPNESPKGSGKLIRQPKRGHWGCSRALQEDNEPSGLPRTV